MVTAPLWARGCDNTAPGDGMATARLSSTRWRRRGWANGGGDDLGSSRGCPLPYPLVSWLCYWAITYVKEEAGCLLSFSVGCQPTATMTDCRELLPRANSKDLVPPSWAVPPGAGAAYLTFWKIELFIFIFTRIMPMRCYGLQYIDNVICGSIQRNNNSVK
jgi:hypothetical protein